jgi:hypothetical protein
MPEQGEATVADATRQQLEALWQAAVASDNEEQIRAAEKRYAAVGLEPPKRARKAASEQRAKAAEEQAAKSGEEARAQEPQGRTSRQQQTTEAGKQAAAKSKE